LRGKEGLRWWFGLAVVGISAGKVPDLRRILLKPGDLSTDLMDWERRFPSRVAKMFFGSGFYWVTKFLTCQLSSRTRTWPSSIGISSGRQAGLWSKHSGTAPVGSLSWLNQFSPGSSSGIHSLMACQITPSGRFVDPWAGGEGEWRR
jgi:hypothetical protein